MKPIYDESLYCQECGEEISIQESKFNNNLCENCTPETFAVGDTVYFKGTPTDERDRQYAKSSKKPMKVIAIGINVSWDIAVETTSSNKLFLKKSEVSHSQEN